MGLHQLLAAGQDNSLSATGTNSSAARAVSPQSHSSSPRKPKLPVSPAIHDSSRSSDRSSTALQWPSAIIVRSTPDTSAAGTSDQFDRQTGGIASCSVSRAPRTAVPGGEPRPQRRYRPKVIN